MIKASDAQALAHELYLQSKLIPDSRACYLVCPTGMTAAKQPNELADVPILTGHGTSTDLGNLIHTFHQWGQPFTIGLIFADGLLQFWVEKDSTQ